MTAKANKNFEHAIELLKEIGLLLVTGSEIPDVCRLVTGKPSKGSWWSNPSAHQIFAVNEALADHADVTLTKLVSNKVTFIHRSLWHRLFAVATERGEWQLSKLSSEAGLLLAELDEKTTLLSTDLDKRFGPKPGDTVRELELRLLIHTDQIHTDKGTHAKILETWEAWAKRIALKPKPMEPATAQRFFETRVSEINQRYVGKGRLPWQPK